MPVRIIALALSVLGPLNLQTVIRRTLSADCWWIQSCGRIRRISWPRRVTDVLTGLLLRVRAYYDLLKWGDPSSSNVQPQAISANTLDSSPVQKARLLAIYGDPRLCKLE